MPRSGSVRFSGSNSTANTSKRRPNRSPKSSGGGKRKSSVSPAIRMKEDLVRAFVEEWGDYYKDVYVPSDLDSKAVYYNVVPYIEDGTCDKFLKKWRETIRLSFKLNYMWGEEDVDEAGRVTLSGFVNNYNDIRMLSQGGSGARRFHQAYLHYRRLWGTDVLGAYRSAARQLHSEGLRLAEIDMDMLKRLKRYFSNRDLGLHMCPPEDGRRTTDDEIMAEVDGNPQLMETLLRRSVGSKLPIRQRLIQTYRELEAQGELPHA